MTVMSTSGTQYTIDQMVRLSYVLAGLLEETQQLSDVGGGALARSFLQIMVGELQGMGIMARASMFYDLRLTAGTFEYTMPSNVLDVFGDAMYIDASETDLTRASSETIVRQMSSDDWNAQSAKDASGRPIRYFVYRVSTPPVVRFWPIPDEAGAVRLQTHRHLADSTAGSATVDLETYWTSYLVTKVAALLAEAKSMPGDKVGRLKSDARERLRDARAMSSSRTGSQAYVSHGHASRRR